jgi:hypothetical protein
MNKLYNIKRFWKKNHDYPCICNKALTQHLFTIKAFNNLLKLFQEWGEEEIKENDGMGEFNYDIL